MSTDVLTVTCDVSVNKIPPISASHKHPNVRLDVEPCCSDCVLLNTSLAKRRSAPPLQRTDSSASCSSASVTSQSKELANGDCADTATGAAQRGKKRKRPCAPVSTATTTANATSSSNDTGSSLPSSTCCSDEDSRDDFVATSSAASSAPSASPNDFVALVRPHTAEWSGADESLFRLFRSLYHDNFCTLAKLIETKSCKQVRGLNDVTLRGCVCVNG